MVAEHDQAVITGETKSGDKSLIGCWVDVAHILPYPEGDRQCKAQITYVPDGVGYPEDKLGKELWIHESSLDPLPHNAKHPKPSGMDPQSPA